jgi:hypothetical protein
MTKTYSTAPKALELVTAYERTLTKLSSALSAKEVTGMNAEPAGESATETQISRHSTKIQRRRKRMKSIEAQANPGMTDQL